MRGTLCELANNHYFFAQTSKRLFISWMMFASDQRREGIGKGQSAIWAIVGPKKNRKENY